MKIDYVQKRFYQLKTLLGTLGKAPGLRTRLLTLLAYWLVAAVQAADLPDGFAETRLAAGLDPTVMEFAPDGRLFVLEKDGKVRIIKNGTLLNTPFLSISVDNNNERGLLGIAFDPNFASNQYVYLYYTVPGKKAHNRVSRFKAQGDVAQAGSEEIIFELNELKAGNHNGGCLFFKGGKLFIATGENAVPNNAQSLNNLLGKILRINPDGSIPSDNPFYNTASGDNRAIWALGLRNPFKAVVQPGTGRIFINDVGGRDWEEINEGLAGKNYGWPGIEGKRKSQTPPANYQDPLFAYGHDQGCSITAGAFYNPAEAQLPASYVGKYFFADYCDGYLKTLDLSSGTAATFATGINRPIDVKIGPDGSLYYLARGGLGGGSVDDNTSSSNGEVWRVQFTNNNVPTISAQPGNKTAPVGASVTFTVGASGTGLSYQWQRNGTNIAGATSASYTLTSVKTADNGAQFRVVVSNAAGSVTSNSATLTVTANRVPVANITSPANHQLYRAGDQISFAGTGFDPEDGNLPASAYDWLVVFHHDTHTHPGPEVTVSADGKSGSFEIPTEGETSANVWYRLFLKVTDSQGLSHTDSVDIDPRVVTLQFNSNPAGMQLNLDGQPITTPYSQQFVSGIIVSLSAPASQNLGGLLYTFQNWLQGLGSGGSITVPDASTTYTASYGQSGSDYRNPENPANAVSGLNYQYYEGNWQKLPDFDDLTPVRKGATTNVSLSHRIREEYFGFRYTGYVQVPEDGRYTFYTNSDDGSRLYIGNQLVVDNDGLHSATEKSGSIGLKAGKHAFTVIYFETVADHVLEVSYAGPGISRQLIPATAYYRLNDGDLTETLTLEAEDAAKSGAYTANQNTGYSGRGYADFVNPDGDYLEWNVNVDIRGVYDLDFRYALGSGSDRPLDVEVNGEVVQKAKAFPNTGGWKTWKNTGLTATLNAGTNKIRLMAVGSSGPNVDYLRITPVSGGRFSKEQLAAETTTVRYYPVPAKDELVVESAAGLGEEIRLVNGQGQLVQTHVLSRKAGQVRLNVADLPAGLYLLTVQAGGKPVTEKIVIGK